MNPEEYEHHVAAVLRQEGWDATVTPFSRDFGIDVLATLGGRRLAVQVKRYGASSTRVNAEQVMCLFGASAYADCTEAMLATDGRLTSDAQTVADKLGAKVRHIAARRLQSAESTTLSERSFGTIWRDYIEPLAGTELLRDNGKKMKILEVDGSGVRRVTTGGNTQRIGIDVFRWTIDRLLAGETVPRQAIHERDPGKVSSGVMLILSRVPGVEIVSDGPRKALRMDEYGA